MRTEIEVLLVEADLREETSPATSEGKREEGLPYHSTLVRRRTLMGAISRRARAMATHGLAVSNEQGVQTRGQRDRTSPKLETRFLPFPLAHTAKAVARMTQIPQTALN